METWKNGKCPIGQARADHFKSDPSNIRKATRAKLSKDQIIKMSAALKPGSAAKPSKGETALLKREDRDAIVVAGEELEKEKPGAGAAVEEATGGKFCRDVHREKLLRFQTGLRPDGRWCQATPAVLPACTADKAMRSPQDESFQQMLPVRGLPF